MSRRPRSRAAILCTLAALTGGLAVAQDGRGAIEAALRQYRVQNRLELTSGDWRPVPPGRRTTGREGSSGERRGLTRVAGATFAYPRLDMPAASEALPTAEESQADAPAPSAQTSSAPAGVPTTGPAPGLAPPGYWREDIWHQMGHEFLQLGGRDFWRGFKTSYWDLENALLLTATMGASIAIRETGVDDTIRGRVKGHRQLGDMDETIQILGNPGTHFAATGVLWLGSALTRDIKAHEVAQTLTQALAVTGVSTILLKVSTNTRAPDGGRLAWPSGHTSSSFAVAAVLNEYYGPWVGVPSLALAGLVGYQRIDSRTHDFSDVVFGAMLGYVIGNSIAKDQKAELPEIWGMKVLPFADPETGTSGLALYRSW